MITLRTVADVRAAVSQARRAGASIGLVPTMGAFHDGHLSLMRRAREQCDQVVVSLFVNPAQFNEQADLDGYPRDERRDAALAARLGVDLLFAPPAEQVYPPGFATTVSVTGVTGTAPLPSRAVAIARVMSVAEANGRAASWMSTICGPYGSKASRPARTEA